MVASLIRNLFERVIASRSAVGPDLIFLYLAIAVILTVQ
jgi:hypothetical protein